MPTSTGMFNHYMNPEQLRKKSFASSIARIFPDGTAPLFALTGQAGRATAKGIKHGYFSKTWEFKTVTTDAGLVGDATLTLNGTATTSGVVPKQIFMNIRTRENIRVDSVNSTTELGITRSFGTVAAAAINANDKWIHIGTAHEQGSARPSARSIQSQWFENYTQIWRNAWALTDTARASMAEAGWNNMAENKRDCSMFHAQDIEATMLFGQKSIDTGGSTPLTTTQGLVDAIHEYAPDNVTTANATTNYDELEDMLTPMFKYNTTASSTKDRLLFTGSQGNKVLNQIGRNHAQAQMTLDQTEMGQTFTTIKTYKGRVHIIEHPMFNGWGYEDLAVVLDLASVKLAYLSGRDTKAEEYGVGGAADAKQGIDAQGGSLTSEAAVEFIAPYTCGIINGLTEGVQ